MSLKVADRRQTMVGIPGSVEKIVEKAYRSGKTLGQILRDLPAGTSREELETYANAYFHLTQRDLPRTLARHKRNEASTREVPKSSDFRKITVEEYYECVVCPIWQHNLKAGEMKPSTVNGYRKTWEYYVHPAIGSRKLSQFDTVSASKFLEDMVARGVGANTFAHIRFVAQRIFGIAAAKGVIPGNPFDHAENFMKPKAPKATRKYSAREIAAILAALGEHLEAQVAVGLCYFCGLRPGEARAVRWDHYVGDGLRIEQSQWRNELTPPKTEASIAVVPVEAPLKDFLEKLRESSPNPEKGFILAGKKNNRALNFDWLAREVIRPNLKKAKLEWSGFYACRRGCSTDIMSLTKDAQGAAGMLRHKNTRVTVNNYIGIAPEHRRRAAKALSANFMEAQKALVSD